MALDTYSQEDNLLIIGQDLLREGANLKIKSTLKVKDFMRPNPPVLSSSDSLKTAAHIIVNNKIDGVPIVDERQNLVGLVTKTLVLREMANGTKPETPIYKFMISDLLSIGPDEDVAALITVNVGNLPVVNNGKVEGIVTLSDTIRAYFSSMIVLRQELNTIIDSTHNGILTVNDKGSIILINKSAEEFLGLNRDNVVGMPISDVIPNSHLLKTLESGKGEFGQKVVYKEKIFISNHTPIINNAQIIGAVAVFQDISELELISEELDFTKQLKDELVAIIESSFDGIHVSDGLGKTLRVNQAFTRITNTSKKEILGKSMPELINAGVFSQSLSDMVLKDRKAATISQISKPGNTVMITANPVFDEENNLFRIVTNVRDISELNMLKHHLEQAQNLTQHYREKIDKFNIVNQYVIRSQKSRDLLDLCIRLAQVDATVLIQGESGVGKEMTAQIIHSNSNRRSKPIVSVNCAAIPESLLESELFGYDPGAFTGASKNGKAGIFETANEGTLFLDEIGELPLNLQSKLLRVIQEKEIKRLGSNKAIKIDIRLIAASNRDLKQMVEQKEFRSDLYYRLNVIPILVPPLRERKVEIPFFVAHFLNKFNSKYGLHKQINEGAIKELLHYDWPGNIRELENFIERIVITYPNDIIRSIDINEINTNLNESKYIDYFTGYSLKRAIAQLEKHLISNAIETCGSSRKAAAELGVSQPTIVRKAAKYGIILGKT